MTRILSFRISNLAGRRGEVSHTLDPHENVCWGVNGSGKTTLLRILNAALSNRSSELHKLPFATAEVEFYSHTRGQTLVRRFDRGNSFIQPTNEEEDWTVGEEAELLSRYEQHLMRSNSDAGWETEVIGGHGTEEGLDVPYKHSYLPISRMLDPLRTETYKSRLPADERFERRVNEVWSRYSAKSLSLVRDIQQRGLAEVLAILFAGTPQHTGTNYPEADWEDPETGAEDAYDIVYGFLRSQSIPLPLDRQGFTARYEDSDQHRHVVTRIRSVMQEVDQVLAAQKELQSAIDEMYIGNKHLVLTQGLNRRAISVSVNDQAIPLDALSSGEKQLLQILLETLAVEESTIMIDEPELSLHPDWQYGLVKSMRRVNSEAQFLLATHSPELMVGVDEAKVFEL